MKKLQFLFIVSMMWYAMLHAQTNLFVSPSGDDSNSGASWNEAKATLSGALTAVSGTTHIFMRVGSYSCANETIPNGVTVTGGYATASAGTDTTQRLYPGTNANWSNATICTILDGHDTSRVATVNAGGKLEGCIVTNGKVNGNGGGLLIDGGTVQHCVIIHNSALDEEDLTAKGGGVYIQNDGYLLNCVVASNFANNGPAVAGTDGTLTNNTITANYAMANCGTVNDYDGNTYNTVIIGEQCWMRENLRTTHYANGVAIALAGTATSTTTAYRYNPGNNASNVSTYGYLYNFRAVMNGASSSTDNPSGVRGICPTGWHVPSNAEWTQLTDFLQSHNAYLCGDYTNSIAKSLASTFGWTTYHTACSVGNQPEQNNTTGFGALPAGYFSSGYYDFCNNCYLWSASNYAIVLYYHSVSVSRTTTSGACSVRCLRD